MTTSRNARVVLRLFYIAVILGLIAFVGKPLWLLLPRYFNLSAEPLSIRQDSKALALAQAAVRDAGYKPEDFVPNSIAYDPAFSDFRRYNFLPSSSSGMSDHPGLYVELRQHDSTVNVTILRRK